IALAWLRGRPPGIGTLIQTAGVGASVNAFLPLMPGPESLALRGVEMVAGLLVLAVGVAGYLAVELGAGPAEAAALAFDPPVPFRWSYTVLQVTSMGVGWVLGAYVGVATVLVSHLLGQFVARLQSLFTSATLRRAAPIAPPEPLPPAAGVAGP